MAEPDPDSHYAQPLPAAIITAAFFCSDLSLAASARTRQRHGSGPFTPANPATQRSSGMTESQERDKNGFQVRLHTRRCLSYKPMCLRTPVQAPDPPPANVTQLWVPYPRRPGFQQP